MFGKNLKYEYGLKLKEFLYTVGRRVRLSVKQGVLRQDAIKRILYRVTLTPGEQGGSGYGAAVEKPRMSSNSSAT